MAVGGMTAASSAKGLLAIMGSGLLRSQKYEHEPFVYEIARRLLMHVKHVAEHTAPMPQIAIRCCPMIVYSSAGPHSANQFMHHRAGKFIFKEKLSADN